MSADLIPHPEAPVYTKDGPLWFVARARMMCPTHISDRMVCDVHAIRKGWDLNDTKARLRALGWRPYQVETFAHRALARAVTYKGEAA